MVRPNSYKNGMSLTELLVATMLVTIIMVGAVSVDYAIRSSRSSSSTLFLISMQANSLMGYLTQDAMMAVGTNLDRGVVSWDNGSTQASIAFRHDTDNDPTSFTGDKWVCYFHGLSGQIQRCVGFNAGSIQPDGECACLVSSSKHDLSFPFQIVDNIFASVVENNGRFNYVEFSFRIRPDINQAAQPLKNPEISLKTRVSPPGQSH